jgi:hypothetical protein
MKRFFYNTAPNHFAAGTSSQCRRNSEGCDWQLLEAPDVQFLVLDPSADRAAVELARGHPGWQLEFEDAEAVFFTRTAA